MKKVVTFSLILVVIVLLHVLLIRLFFNKEEQQPPATQGEMVSVASTENVNVATKDPAPLLRYRQPTTNPLFGRYFTYGNTVWGDIDIPGSKEVRTGILVNLDTRRVLWAKKPRVGTPIASMTKMMTLLLAFEELERNHDLSLETPVNISPAAHKVGGSQVYLDPRETHQLGELLKTVAIKSANDSAYQVAEFVGSGDVNGFVAAMNHRARQLLMANTNFVNPHGLPGSNGQESTSSAEGMAILAERLLEYPQVMEWTATYHSGFRPENSPHYQLLTNTNRLVRDCPGVDGIKTGYIKASGFCVTASCLRNGKRLIAVVTGFKTHKARNSFVSKLFDWGYARMAQL